MVGTTWRKVDIPSYLLRAILVTMFCFMPVGIVAIVYASRVNSHMANGNYIAAKMASDKARLWCLASFGIVAVPAFLLFWLWLMRGPGFCCPR